MPDKNASVPLDETTELVTVSREYLDGLEQEVDWARRTKAVLRRLGGASYVVSMLEGRP